MNFGTPSAGGRNCQTASTIAATRIIATSFKRPPATRDGAGREALRGAAQRLDEFIGEHVLGFRGLRQDAGLDIEVGHRLHARLVEGPELGVLAAVDEAAVALEDVGDRGLLAGVLRDRGGVGLGHAFRIRLDVAHGFQRGAHELADRVGTLLDRVLRHDHRLRHAGEELGDEVDVDRHAGRLDRRGQLRHRGNRLQIAGDHQLHDARRPDRLDRHVVARQPDGRERPLQIVEAVVLEAEHADLLAFQVASVFTLASLRTTIWYSAPLPSWPTAFTGKPLARTTITVSTVAPPISALPSATCFETSAPPLPTWKVDVEVLGLVVALGAREMERRERRKEVGRRKQIRDLLGGRRRSDRHRGCARDRGLRVRGVTRVSCYGSFVDAACGRFMRSARRASSG